MLFGKIKKWFSKTLLGTTPNYVFVMLENFGIKAGLLKGCHNTYQPIWGEGHRVYDLVNCGLMNRFVVNPSRPMYAHNCQYGAGVRKVHQTLEEQEIYLDFEQVEAVHRGYWELFAGVKDFAKSLYFQWRRNRGFIINGMGRPMAVPEHYNKDMLNRFIQSTGHDILVKYISILCAELQKAGISYVPVIIDWHDASTVEVPEDRAEDAVACFNRAMDKLNNQLNGTIKLKGVAVVGRNLAEVKEPES